MGGKLPVPSIRIVRNKTISNASNKGERVTKDRPEQEELLPNQYREMVWRKLCVVISERRRRKS